MIILNATAPIKPEARERWLAPSRDGGGALKYLSGEMVLVGDVVRVAFQTPAVEARLKLVLAPGSAEAIGWNAPEGGVMIESEATGLVLWRATDEDMEFVRRG